MFKEINVIEIVVTIIFYLWLYIYKLKSLLPSYEYSEENLTLGLLLQF